MPVGREREVTRAGARFHGDIGWSIRRKYAALGIEMKDSNTIGSEIGHKQKSIVRRENHGMRVRSFLAGLIGPGTGKLHFGYEAAERTIGLDWKRGGAAGAVVRNE